MARPPKEGLDYFPLDTTMEEKVQLLEEMFGNDGFATLVKMWQAIYRTVNGELNCTSEAVRRLHAKRCNVRISTWQKIIDFSAGIGLFDPTAWQSKILTSNGVKKRIAKILHERKKSQDRYNKTKEVRGDSRRETTSETNNISLNSPPISRRETIGETGESIESIESIETGKGKENPLEFNTNGSEHTDGRPQQLGELMEGMGLR